MDSGIGSYAVSSIVTRPAPAPNAPPPAAPPQRVAAPVAAANERRVERDAATDSLVYRMIDTESGAVLVQTPDEARLRLRAYLAKQEAQPTPPTLQLTA